MVWDFTLYLLYGLAIFTLGVAILSRDTRLSELGIARIIWLLAVFGIVHGFHEWLELLDQFEPDLQSAGFYMFRLVTVSVSFLFLLYFGLFLNIITIYGDNALKATPNTVKILVGIAAFACIILAIYLDSDSGKDLHVRRMVAFPGGLLSGIGLIFYSRTVRTFSLKVARNFILAGGFMVGYAIFTGIIPSDAVVPLIDAKIILFRGLCAFFIMFFTIRALSVFSIEQRKLINEQLLRFSQSEKLTSMGILAAGIAHEINNPLTNASLNLEMLKDLVGGSDKVDAKLESINRNIVRAAQIAKELLRFSRQKETDLEPVDLNEIIRSSRNLLRNQKLSSIIHLNLNDVPHIMGIVHKLEEVFINILMNSLDACEEKDRIEIDTFSESSHVIAVVNDTGHGISSDEVSRVFDPFFTTKEVGKGTGLGLSVVFNIIEQHNGNISFVSSEQGGTVVTIKFPRVEEDE
ncbi:MAG: HAMP domain-containing histidine kinase [Desulfofustis sp.]|nr:HAMP domain-containing histidine kinase [Desulfofustis sp.]